MKPFIPLAIAITALPLLGVAQSPDAPRTTQSGGKDDGSAGPSAPVPMPTVPPPGSPVEPPRVPAPNTPPVELPRAPTPSLPQVPTPPPSVPTPEPPTSPGKPDANRPDRPDANRPDRPDRPDASRPDENRPGRPDARPESPTNPKHADPTPTPSAPEANEKPRGKSSERGPDMKAPSTSPTDPEAGAPQQPTPSTRPTRSAAKAPAETRERPSDPNRPITPGQQPADSRERAETTPRPASSTPGEPSAPSTTPMPAAAASSDLKATATPSRPNRPIAEKPPSKETARVLEDQEKRDRKADAARAQKIEGKEDAQRLIMSILGAAVGGAAAQARIEDRPQRGYRPPVEEVGRSQVDRERSVNIMVQRFQGQAPPSDLQETRGREMRHAEFYQGPRAPRFYEGNRRVVRYSSFQEIPPVIVASQQLNRVEVVTHSQSNYEVAPPATQSRHSHNEPPSTYTDADAYAVSYSVDPNSAISRDDILFRQGSTDFADAYSYDIVIDMAEAMTAPELKNESFVVEGHASAEGDYGQNLQLSQERAERISRELVRHGVSPERLMPVGYGEAEAAYPADTTERERSLDRRVMVFRMR